MAKFCPFMSHQKGNCSLIYCDTECALWDEHNQCCSFKRISVFDSPDMFKVHDNVKFYDSKTGSPPPEFYNYQLETPYWKHNDEIYGG